MTRHEPLGALEDRGRQRRTSCVLVVTGERAVPAETSHQGLVVAMVRAELERRP